MLIYKHVPVMPKHFPGVGVVTAYMDIALNQFIMKIYNVISMQLTSTILISCSWFLNTVTEKRFVYIHCNSIQYINNYFYGTGGFSKALTYFDLSRLHARGDTKTYQQNNFRHLKKILHCVYNTLSH